MSSILLLCTSRSRGSFRGRGRSNFSSNRGFSGGRSFNRCSSGLTYSFNRLSSSTSNYSSNSECSGRVLFQICSRLGHGAFDCYNRMNFAYQGQHPPLKLTPLAATYDSSGSTST